MSIADDICTRSWISKGAVGRRDNSPEQESYFPKYGIVFKTTAPQPFSIQAVYGIPTRKSDDGKTAYDVAITPLVKRSVRFTVDQQTYTPAIDPLTGLAMVKFPPAFKAQFEALDFIEYGDNCLVGGPILVEDLGQAVSYMIEIIKNTTTGKLAMMQRARWSGGYYSTYCCEEM